MCECHQPQAVAPDGLSCICHMSWHARASSVYMCKSQILLLGMSQASLDTLLRWWCLGPSWRLPPERHRAGGCQAGEWLGRAHTALCLLSIPLGAICGSTEGTGGWSSLPRSSPWLGSTGSASFPSTPEAHHGLVWGSQTLSKSPATSRGSSVGRMARLLLRKPHGLQRFWDPEGQRLEIKGQASPLPICTLLGDAKLLLDLRGGHGCQLHITVQPVHSGNLPAAPSRGFPVSQSEHPRR